MAKKKTIQPTVLIIMDGFGISRKKEGNAIYHAKTPNLDEYFKKYPFTKLKASGKAVGVPRGSMGSSEVGHLNIGAGRIVKQDQVRITQSIKNKSFFDNKSLIDAINHAKKNNSNLHIMGLLQDQGVHAQQDHLFAMLKLCKQHNIEPIIHIISDGRDTLPKSTKTYIDKLKKVIKRYPGKLASITGRYYAMDRDTRWDRTKLFYQLLTKGTSKSKEFNNIYDAVEDAYDSEETDEFIKPRRTKDFQKIKNKDSIFFFNYRSDRARQITKAFVELKFRNFNTEKLNIYFVAMTEYYKGMSCNVAFERGNEENILAKVLEDNKKSQLRVAETEKYAHVTFFFNDEIETPYKKEDRILVPSPRIATYDLKPEMSAYEITDNVINQLDKNKHDLIVINYANCDMVGHTGVYDAAVKAVEAVDECVGNVVNKTLEMNGKVMIIADHGNAEKLKEKDGSPNTAHTTNKVPCCIIGSNAHFLKWNGKLADVAPTLLKLINIEKPKEMTGKNLILF